MQNVGKHWAANDFLSDDICTFSYKCLIEVMCFCVCLQLMSLGAQGQQLFLQNQFAAAAVGQLPSVTSALPNLAALGPQELQALQQTLQQHHQSLQQQLQQYVLFQPGTGAQLPAQAQFFLQNQVSPWISVVNFPQRTYTICHTSQPSWIIKSFKMQYVYYHWNSKIFNDISALQQNFRQNCSKDKNMRYEHMGLQQ